MRTDNQDYNENEKVVNDQARQKTRNQYDAKPDVENYPEQKEFFKNLFEILFEE